LTPVAAFLQEHGKIPSPPRSFRSREIEEAPQFSAGPTTVPLPSPHPRTASRPCSKVGRCRARGRRAPTSRVKDEGSASRSNPCGAWWPVQPPPRHPLLLPRGRALEATFAEARVRTCCVRRRELLPSSGLQQGARGGATSSGGSASAAEEPQPAPDREQGREKSSSTAARLHASRWTRGRREEGAAAAAAHPSSSSLSPPQRPFLNLCLVESTSALARGLHHHASALARGPHHHRGGKRAHRGRRCAFLLLPRPPVASPPAFLRPFICHCPCSSSAPAMELLGAALVGSGRSPSQLQPLTGAHGKSLGAGAAWEDMAEGAMRD
jgi:hypothetical protein